MSCFLWFHKWGKWYEDGEGRLTQNGIAWGRFVRMKRECERCGMVGLKQKNVY